jgi:hypothetical protein
MNRYEIALKITGHRDFIIEAESAEEAEVASIFIMEQELMRSHLLDDTDITSTVIATEENIYE